MGLCFWGDAMMLRQMLQISALACALVMAPLRAESGLLLQPFSEGLEPLTTLNGQPHLLQFWASWCRSCFRVMDDIERLSEAYPAVTYLAISIDENMAEPAAALLPQPAFSEHPHRFWFDQAGGLSEELSVVTTPTLVLLDADGVERHRHMGHFNSADLQTLRRHLQALGRED